MNWTHNTRFVIRDRGTKSFDTVFSSIDAHVIHTPPGAPRANAFAERWVRSVRHEILKQPKGLPRTLIWNQRQLQQLLNEYVTHYNQHRPHQGIEQRAPDDTKPAELVEVDRPVTRTPVCGGLINEYRPAA